MLLLQMIHEVHYISVGFKLLNSFVIRYNIRSMQHALADLASLNMMKSKNGLIHGQRLKSRTFLAMECVSCQKDGEM